VAEEWIEMHDCSILLHLWQTSAATTRN